MNRYLDHLTARAEAAEADAEQLREWLRKIVAHHEKCGAITHPFEVVRARAYLTHRSWFPPEGHDNCPDCKWIGEVFDPSGGGTA